MIHNWNLIFFFLLSCFLEIFLLSLYYTTTDNLPVLQAQYFLLSPFFIWLWMDLVLLIDSFSRVSDVSISFANALIAEPKTRPKALIGAVHFTKLHIGPPTDTCDSWREQLNVKIDALEWWCVLLFNLDE